MNIELRKKILVFCILFSMLPVNISQSCRIFLAPPALSEISDSRSKSVNVEEFVRLLLSGTGSKLSELEAAIDLANQNKAVFGKILAKCSASELVLLNRLRGKSDAEAVDMLHWFIRNSDILIEHGGGAVIFIAAVLYSTRNVNGVKSDCAYEVCNFIREHNKMIVSLGIYTVCACALSVVGFYGPNAHPSLFSNFDLFKETLANMRKLNTFLVFGLRGKLNRESELESSVRQVEALKELFEKNGIDVFIGLIRKNLAVFKGIFNDLDEELWLNLLTGYGVIDGKDKADCALSLHYLQMLSIFRGSSESNIFNPLDFLIRLADFKSGGRPAGNVIEGMLIENSNISDESKRKIAGLFNRKKSKIEKGLIIKGLLRLYSGYSKISAEDIDEVIKKTGKTKSIIEVLNFLPACEGFLNRQIITPEEFAAAAYSSNLITAIMEFLPKKIFSIFDVSIDKTAPETLSVLSDTDFVVDLIKFKEVYTKNQYAGHILAELVKSYFEKGVYGIMEYKAKNPLAKQQMRHISEEACLKMFTEMQSIRVSSRLVKVLAGNSLGNTRVKNKPVSEEAVSAEISFDLKETLKIGRYGNSGWGNCQSSSNSTGCNYSLMSYIGDAQELVIICRNSMGEVIGFSLLHGVYTGDKFAYVREKVYANNDSLVELMESSASKLCEVISAKFKLEILDSTSDEILKLHVVKIPESRVARYFDSIFVETDDVYRSFGPEENIAFVYAGNPADSPSSSHKYPAFTVTEKISCLSSSFQNNNQVDSSN